MGVRPGLARPPVALGSPATGAARIAVAGVAGLAGLVGLVGLALLVVLAAPAASHGDDAIAWRVAIRECEDGPCLVVVEGPTSRLPAGEEVHLGVRNEATTPHNLRLLAHHADGTQEPIVETGLLEPEQDTSVNFEVPDAGGLRLSCGEPGHDETLELSVVAKAAVPREDTPLAGVGLAVAGCIGAAALHRRSG